MASGTLRNLETSAFVRTPPSVVRDIISHLLGMRDGDQLLALPTALSRGRSTNVLDPTCGAGDLLEPLGGLARLFGVEISRERADEARVRLPHATIITSAFEATRITPRSIGLVLTNPPYMSANGTRLEYSVIRDAGEALAPGGVMVAIVPARQWDGTMANHWAKHYTNIRCWKFRDNDPDADEEAFDHYTQIVVAGVRRERPLETPEPAEKARIRGWRWRTPEQPHDSPWAQGDAPPDLPTAPIDDRYAVPAATVTPTITVMKADDATLLKGLEASGAHLTPAWQSATTWQEHGRAERPVMPPTGTAHLAADILTGLFDGEIVYGPDTLPYVFTTFVTTELVPVEVDDEARAKHITRILQQQDKAVLGVLSLTSGEISYYQGEAAFAFLAPWLPTLAAQVLARREPIYTLDPADWELEVVASIGTDKTLPGAEHPGLAVPQMHRVFAMYRAICALGAAAIQGEPGTGKTRMSTALFAEAAYAWRTFHAEQEADRQEMAQARAAWQALPAEERTQATLSSLRRKHCTPKTLFGTAQPAWMRRLKQAWKANPNTIGDRPRALPLLVATPKRVVPVWEYEIAAAWPEAEVVVIETYQDVRRWLLRCAETSAPAVIAIVPHSLTRPGRITWTPAVLEKTRTVEVPDLDPAHAIVLDAVHEGGQPDKPVIGYRDTATGRLLTKHEQQPRFFCPDCGALVEAEPRSLHRVSETVAIDAAEAEATAEDKLQPVTSITFFTRKQQTCRHCRAPLWTREWTPATLARAGRPSFAEWSKGVARMRDGVAAAAPDGKARCPKGQLVRLAKAASGPIGITNTRYDGKASAWVDETASLDLAAPIGDSFSPFHYLVEFFKGCAAIAVIDESHNARGKDTDISEAIHQAIRSSQSYVFASGTHYGGSIDDFFYYWLRFDPGFWQRLGLGWGDVQEAMSTYGVIQQVTREYESDARKGSGKTDVRVSTIAAPGISAKLLPHLLGKMLFIGTLDVGAFMPELIEYPEVVDMDDPTLRLHVEQARADAQLAQDEHAGVLQDQRDLQDDVGATTAELAAAALEAASAVERVAAAQAALQTAEERARDCNLGAHYAQVASTLEKLAEKKSSAAMLAKGTLPRWWAALPCVEPAFTVTTTQRGDWGDVMGSKTIFTAPVLPADHIYPLERRLRAIVTDEMAEGRTVMCYYEQNDVRDTARRLSWVLEAFNPWTLPNSVDPEDREDAIKAAVASGRKVVIVPYRRVSEGLNLQCIDTIAWFEMPMNLFLLGQANRRAWRLGKREQVRIYYLVYRGTVAHQKLTRLGSQSGAAALFNGDTPDGALVRHAGADKTTLARMSQGLDAREEDLKEAFARRSAELAAALRSGRDWIGVTDTLPARLAALRAATVIPPLAEVAVGATFIPTAGSAAVGLLDAAMADSPPAALDLPCEPPRPARPLVQFGDLAAIDSALRRVRRARRAAAPASSPLAQQDMFGAEAPTASRKPAERRAAASVASGQASLF